jgi:hypothetical protein
LSARRHNSLTLWHHASLDFASKTREQGSRSRRYSWDSYSPSQGLGRQQLKCVVAKQCGQAQEIRLGVQWSIYILEYTLSFPWILLNLI